MAMQALSIILYAALHTAQPCEKVFVDTAYSANPALKTEERPYLDEFAKAACATSNPDILWLLGLQETAFRFVIIRENKGKTFKITEGPAAFAALKALKKKSRSKTSSLRRYRVIYTRMLPRPSSSKNEKYCRKRLF